MQDAQFVPEILISAFLVGCREQVVSILHAMPTARKGRPHAPGRASEPGNIQSLAPTLVIRKDAWKDVAWAVSRPIIR